MDQLDSLRSTYRTSITAIEMYLSSEIPGSQFRLSEDVERDCVVFRTTRESTATFRIFVSHEFLSDTNEKHIAAVLRRWNVAEEAAALLRGYTLFVVSNGTFKEQTEGQTLRESAETFAAMLPHSEALTDIYKRVFGIRVNGTPLGDIPSEMQGDPDLYISYSEDFANTLGAAYLLDASGYRNFALNTPALEARGRNLGVDFEVRLASGEIVYLQFKRAITPAERRMNALREQTNVDLRTAMRDRADLAAAVEGHFIQITLPIAPKTKAEVASLVDEIIRFAISRDWADYPSDSLVPFDENRYALLSKLGAQVYVSTGATYLSVTEAGKTFDRYAPYRLAKQLISQLSGQRFDLHPVWLGISIADTVIFPSSAELNSLIRSIDQMPHPFDKIVVGSVQGARVWPSA